MAQTMPGTVIPKPLPWLWIFLLAGTVVRIAYAVLFKPWWEAADHLAWAIVLKSVGHVAGLGYWQFIHYPQEGGSIPISLLTLLIGRIPGIAALPASALLVDAFSRWVQLKVVAARFDRKVFLLFGAWTVCGLPILITWSSVNCGLHNLSSFFPFVVLWLISRPSEVNARVWTDGLVLGLAVWFSYNCLLLLPVYLLLSRPLFQGPGPLFRSSAAFVAVLAVHFLFRTSFDPGFHLPEWSPVSVRGLHFQRPVGGMIHDMGDVWTHALAQLA